MKKLLIGLLLMAPLAVRAQGSGTMYMNYMHLLTTTKDTTTCQPSRLLWGYNGDTIVFAFPQHILVFLKDKSKVKPQKVNEPFEQRSVEFVKQLDTEEEWYIRVIRENRGVGFMIGKSTGLPVYFFTSTNICE